VGGSEEELEAAAALELLKDIRDDILQIGPTAPEKSIKKEADLTLIRLKRESMNSEARN
jgi:hypothetical protein